MTTIFAQKYYPTYPLAKNDKEGSFVRRNKAEALQKYLFLQNNNPTYKNLIVVDLDKKLGLEDTEAEIRNKIYDMDVAHPHYITENPTTGNTQLGWFTDGTISTNNQKADKLFTATQKTLTHILGGDRNYGNTFLRNPQLQRSYFYNEPPLYLSETFKKIKQHYPTPSNTTPTETGEGRNTQLFNEVRVFAYKKYSAALPTNTTRQAEEEIENYANYLNSNLGHPLTQNELQTIIRSILKFCRKKMTLAGRKEWGEAGRARSLKVRQQKATTNIILAQMILNDNPTRTLKSVAAELGVSYTHFSRTFKEYQAIP